MFTRMPEDRRVNLTNIIFLYCVFFLCLYIVIIRPLGPDLANIPGDLTDARFNSYILEHFYQYISGIQSEFWTAPFFYPFPHTIAFSDNHLGTGLIYSLFRWIGYDREAAFQYWFLISFFLNFTASSYVLFQYYKKILVVFAGSFLFTFGLPVLAQDIHAQLAYRFCIPLSCYFLLLFFQKPAIKYLLLCLFLTTWQFYISIYLGYFLLLLLIAVAAVIPFQQTHPNLQSLLSYWPFKLRQAWTELALPHRWIAATAFAFIISMLFFLIYPYFLASRVYDMTRSWSEIETMLPRWQSYLTADRALSWQPMNAWISTFAPVLPMRWEHQMFIGLPALVLILLSPILSRQIRKGPHFSVYGLGLLIIIMCIMDFGGFSFYKLLRVVPGINSFRAVSRIILVMMWPVAVLCAAVLAQLLKSEHRYFRILALGFVLSICIDLSFFTLLHYSKDASQNRIRVLKEEYNSTGIANPIIFVSQNDKDQWQISEIDGMLLAQDLKVPTLNGYSGFFPYGIMINSECNQPQYRLARYVDFIKEHKKQTYQTLESRVVTIGMDHCKVETISAGTGRAANPKI